MDDLHRFVGTWTGAHVSGLSHHTITWLFDDGRLSGKWCIDATDTPENRAAAAAGRPRRITMVLDDTQMSGDVALFRMQGAPFQTEFRMTSESEAVVGAAEDQLPELFRQPEYSRAIEGHRVRLTRASQPPAMAAAPETRAEAGSASDVAAVVQRQLDAYNARSLDALIATYAPDAEQFLLHGECLASGHEEIRRRMAVRFQEPNLHVVLLNRTVMGTMVVDHERVTRNFPEGRGTIEMICIYEVRDGLIRRGTFALGDKVLEAKA